jgi:putative toxin-antitoxin system antitoxin component (TIGR02293 family)
MAVSASAQLIAGIKQGVAFAEFEQLRLRLGVSTGLLAAVIHISDRTLARRKQEGRLQPDESDRLYRIGRLYQRALEVLGDPAAQQWLTSPKRFLEGKTPLEFADTEVGAHEIELALGRLEHGVFT